MGDVPVDKCNAPLAAIVKQAVLLVPANSRSSRSSRASPLWSWKREKMAPVLEKQLSGAAEAGNDNAEDEEGQNLWQVMLLFQ